MATEKITRKKNKCEKCGNKGFYPNPQATPESPISEWNIYCDCFCGGKLKYTENKKPK